MMIANDDAGITRSDCYNEFRNMHVRYGTIRYRCL